MKFGIVEVVVFYDVVLGGIVMFVFSGVVVSENGLIMF